MVVLSVAVLDASDVLERSNASGGAVVVVAGVASDEGVVLGGVCEPAAGVHVVAVDSIRLWRLELSWEDRDDICYSKHSLLSSSSYNPPRWLRAL